MLKFSDMLVQFSIKNFKTFRERATLSMIASNYDKDTREEENVTHDDKFNLRILKSAVIYGANASGKSKFLDAMLFMKYFVINSSSSTQLGDPIRVSPFRLNTTSINEPTEFEIIFIHNKEMFRYGFEITQEKVHTEWLYHKPKTKEVELFYREGTDFDSHPRNFSIGQMLQKGNLVRPNALMISVAAQFNDKVAARILSWFDNFRGLSGLDEDPYQGYTMGRTNDPLIKKRIISLLNAADLYIKDIQLEHVGEENLPDDMPKKIKEKILRDIREGSSKYYSDVLTSHRVYDELNNHVSDTEFSMEDDESTGTKKFFALTGPILDALDRGLILIVDELDSKLHPNLVGSLVSLFNNKRVNKNNAQLIFNTQNTNLLESGLFRRDQIWFTQKDRYGAAKIFSLSDFKSEVRKGENFEDNYIRGKYGALPYITDMEQTFQE